MDYYDKNNTTLSISSVKIKDCSEVANYMKKCGLRCHVSSNYTVIQDRNTKEYICEQGCQIKFGNHIPSDVNEKLWNGLKKEYDLTCTHIEVISPSTTVVLIIYMYML